METLENDEALFEFIEKNLYTAVICDVLDELGYYHQAMHQRLRPLLPDIRNCGFVGRARTLQWLEVDSLDPDNPYGLEIEAMDLLKKGDVVVHSTDLNGTNAPWGELMSTMAMRRGVTGCVCDSQIRDCIRIIEMNFPVYYAGIRPLNSKGRAIVTAYDIPVKCGDVLVSPGDLIFADFDGVVVIPKEIESELIARVSDKIRSEDLSRDELLSGKTLSEVYSKYKAL